MGVIAVRQGYSLARVRQRSAMSPLNGAQRTYAIAKPLQSVFDIALNVESLSGPHTAALRRLYAFTVGTARCRVGPELSRKYNMDEDNAQVVVSVTNRATLEQAWFNETRTRKPQTFKADGAAVVDPTDGGRKCDFCSWQALTAEDPWGRVELPHAVTGSNLFKYGEPAHGLVLFKHHDPLTFSRGQLSDFLAVSAGWFAAAAAAHPEAHHPFFIWNCGPRAGASQFHGHGQLMLTRTPVPAQARLTQQAELHALAHLGASYYSDLVRAHAAVGLARLVGQGADSCWVLAHLAPQKDMEVVLLGHSLASPSFVTGLHATLRALVDGLGVQTFNCGILNVPLDGQGRTPNGDGVAAADADAGGASSPAAEAVPADSDGACESLPKARQHPEARGHRPGREALELEMALGLPEDVAGWRPMMARVVSRGRVTSPASDFGCLEVVGHASIGHTDPFVLVRAIDEQLAAAAVVTAAAVHGWE